MKPTIIEHTVQLPSGALETVEIACDVEIVDAGIGAYEYWGCKQYDRRLQPECTNWSWHFSNPRIMGGLSEDQVLTIEQQINEFMFDKGCTLAEEQYADDPEPPERD